MLTLFDGARARAGLPQQSSLDADAEALMAKAREEHKEEQEFANIAFCETPAPAVPAVGASPSSLRSVLSVSREDAAMMNVDREHALEAGEEHSQRKFKAPTLSADQVMQLSHQDESDLLPYGGSYL